MTVSAVEVIAKILRDWQGGSGTAGRGPDAVAEEILAALPVSEGMIWDEGYAQGIADASEGRQQ